MSKLVLFFKSFNLIPVVNVFENIEYPCYVMKEKRDKNKQRDYIDFLLENVGMVDKKYKRPSQLSGWGEASVSPLPGRLSTSRKSYLPMSQRLIWIIKPGKAL